jgi:hypothetical protein
VRKKRYRDDTLAVPRNPKWVHTTGDKWADHSKYHRWEAEKLLGWLAEGNRADGYVRDLDSPIGRFSLLPERRTKAYARRAPNKARFAPKHKWKDS